MFTTGGATAYTATKAAQAAMSNQLVVELGRYKIRVNAVAPGPTRTRIARALDDAFSIPEVVQPLVARTALGRLGAGA